MIPHQSVSLVNIDHEFKTRIIEIVRGHSKDHRDDLKQSVLSLVTNQDDIPVCMEPLSGNGSDKKILPNSIEAVRSLHGKTVIPFTVEGALATPEPPVATTPRPFPCRPGARARKRLHRLRRSH